MYRIRDILKRTRIRILGSVHWVTDPGPELAPDPDTAIFARVFFAYKVLTVGTFTSIFKDNKSLSTVVTEQLKSSFFLNFSARCWKDPDQGVTTRCRLSW